ncbi:hypothetical protein J2T57_003577 [Natronocella acetinitrilica]|uniref:DUF3047 domain-containing protein n=1 Tax=Natronocella acetinitrilica TaxID=414046 RepID=A0AAE3KD44_9GAMM|nr:DUF3047 domain-containing protein [Natronocella acetinitrilica]MCP1676416.1 hypothetical protein [Natronocella acetinitrilica]
MHRNNRRSRQFDLSRLRAVSCAFLLGPLLLAAGAAHGAERTFEPADIVDWDNHSFEGETRYDLVEIDGRPAVHAVCTDSTASGLFFREEIDLEQTPIIEWSWRVDEVFDDLDETVRAGDDYPARLYVVDERTVLRWRTRALNYVWSSDMEQGADWPNAYASQARMIAVRSGTEDGGTWVTERRNIRDDFQRFHDQDKTSINAIAIMTDCDDTGQEAEAWYGEIRLLAE